MRAVSGSGTVCDERRGEGFRAVLVDHRNCMCLGEHTHEQVKLSIVLQGGVTERDGHTLHAPAPFDILFRSSDRPHSNQYHVNGARSLLIELDPKSLEPSMRASSVSCVEPHLRTLISFKTRRRQCGQVPNCVRLRSDGSDEVAGIAPNIAILPTEKESPRARAVRMLHAISHN